MTLFQGSEMHRKNKPVWRLNTGDGVPSDLKFKIISKTLRFGHASEAHKSNDDFWILNGEDELTVYAYETNRTREAKYEQVECKECINNQFKGLVYCGGYFEYRKCPRCNGKCYTLDTIK